MAISFVQSADFSTSGTATTTVQTRIPLNISEGDLLVAGYGNVGNPNSGSFGSGVASTQNGWDVVDEVTDGQNSYALIMCKTATASDVSNAGNTTQIATLTGSNGSTFQACPCAAYSGAADQSVQFSNSNLNHVPSPGFGVQTVSTGSTSNDDSDNWYMCIFFAATGGGGGPGSFTSSTAPGERGDSSVGTTGLIATVGLYDSAGTIPIGSAGPESGTVNYDPSRLNGWIGIIQAATPPGNNYVQNESDDLTLQSQASTTVNSIKTYTQGADDDLGLHDSASINVQSPTQTTRLNLNTSPVGSSIDLTSDINVNWDTLDEVIGFGACTSSTRPTVVWPGLCIFETDTSRTYVSDGGSWIEIPNGGISIEPSTLILTGLSAGSDTVFVSYLQNENHFRSIIDADGTVWWGDGVNPVDVKLYRSDISKLTTNSTLESDHFVSETFKVTSDTDETIAFETSVEGQDNPTFKITGDGSMYWGDGDALLDVTMYRDATTGKLTHGNDFVVTGSLEIEGIGQTRFVQKSSDTSRSSTTITNDPHLSLAVDANATYEVEMWLSLKTTANNDLQTVWNAPTGSTGFKSVLGATDEDTGNDSRLLTNIRTGIHFYDTVCIYQVDTDDQAQWAYERGTITMGPSPGTLSLGWSAASAGGGLSRITQYSYMKVTKVA